MKNRITIILAGVVLTAILSGCSIKIFENLKNVKQAIASQEKFVGITKEQVVDRFGKPATFQSMGAIRGDGQSERIEILTYPTWNWRIIVILKNNIVTEVDYEMHPSLKRKSQQEQGKPTPS